MTFLCRLKFHMRINVFTFFLIQFDHNGFDEFIVHKKMVFSKCFRKCQLFILQVFYIYLPLGEFSCGTIYNSCDLLIFNESFLIVYFQSIKTDLRKLLQLISQISVSWNFLPNRHLTKSSPSNDLYQEEILIRFVKLNIYFKLEGKLWKGAKI